MVCMGNNCTLGLDMVCMGNRAAAPPRRYTTRCVARAPSGHNRWPFGPTLIKSYVRLEHGLHGERLYVTLGHGLHGE